MTTVKEGCCSMQEVRGFVGGQHGREQAVHTLLCTVFTGDRAAEDKHGPFLRLNPQLSVDQLITLAVYSLFFFLKCCF